MAKVNNKAPGESQLTIWTRKERRKDYLGSRYQSSSLKREETNMLGSTIQKISLGKKKKRRDTYGDRWLDTLYGGTL